MPPKPDDKKTPSKQRSKRQQDDDIVSARNNSSVADLYKPSASEGQVGEPLLPCSDSEWDHSENAYSAELLNVKKKKNRVTVFAGPGAGQAMGSVSVRQHHTKQSPKKENANENSDNRANQLAKLFTGVARTLLDDRDKTHGVEVTVSVRINGGISYVVPPPSQKAQ